MTFVRIASMGESLRKFVNRAARYFFSPDDDHFVRFSRNGEVQATYAEMLNISSTGLAFIINKASSPKDDELIKVELTIPGGEQLAWWARVRRVMDFVPNESWASTAREDLIGLNMVGVEFENFPEEEEEKLSQQLELHFSKVKKNVAKKVEKQTVSFFVENWSKFALIFVCLAVIVVVCYYLSKPLL